MFAFFTDPLCLHLILMLLVIFGTRQCLITYVNIIVTFTITFVTVCLLHDY